MDETQPAPGAAATLDFGFAPPKPAEQYRVLARKYRPSDFTGLIGQDALVRTLRNAFASGRIAHAFMLTGVRGVGKTTTARIVARALNCIGPDGARKEPAIQPCGQCEPCRAIAESRYVDVQEMDAASNNGIDEVRQIIESVRYAPASARYKVYILDEVHMLSKPAFNAILKTLEEPPPHVKFIFATTEIRKVPVTILSRCQRFDLRRVDPALLVAHLKAIAAEEAVMIEEGALALIARAAEGSVRDALSLLDQAIAHDEGGMIEAQSVRAMLGLADRGRVLDLFEQVMGGRIAEALAGLTELHDVGADPLQIMQDLLEITHFLTRLRVAPAAEGVFDGGSGEARRAAEMAARLPVPALSRAWQILLKGLIEVRDATRPLAACEMALIRLAYAADLPPADKLIKEVLDQRSTGQIEGGPRPAPRGGPGRAAPPVGASAAGTSYASAPQGDGGAAMQASQLAAEPQVQTGNVEINGLEDLVALALAHNANVLKVHIENDIHLVALEPGRLEFRPGPRAPRTLAGDLSQKLREWTGERWVVSLAREGGAPTLSEAKKSKAAARLESVLADPNVRAVLERFPGAEVVRVIEREIEAVAESEEDGRDADA